MSIYEEEVWQGLFWDIINLTAFYTVILHISFAPQKILVETENMKSAVIDLCEKTSHDSNENKRVIFEVFNDFLNTFMLLILVRALSFTIIAPQSESLHFTNVRMQFYLDSNGKLTFRL